MGSIADFFSYLGTRLSTISVIDVIDILIVSVLFYYVIVFFRDRRAGKLAVGVLFLLLALLISTLLEMRATQSILETIVGVGVLALIIIFQPELRTMLEKMGRNSLSGLNRLVDLRTDDEKLKVLNEVCLAAGELSQSKTGALIVIERKTKLGDEIRTGTELNADVSAPLIRNIFYNKAPLHDGAMILRGGRIYAGGCFLPLSASTEIDRRLGTRHRAALGVSEISDAVVVVVSEETGGISIAIDGKLYQGFDKYTLQNRLLQIFELDVSRSRALARRKKEKKNAKTEDAPDAPQQEDDREDL